MVGRALVLSLGLALVWGCGGEPAEEPAKQQPTTPATTTPADTPAGGENDDDYEELDVWIEADPDEGPPPLRVHFTSEVDAEEEGGGPYQFKWDFGDAANSTEANPIHTYAKLGEYTVTCMVTDAKGNNGSDEIDVWVEEE